MAKLDSIDWRDTYDRVLLYALRRVRGQPDASNLANDLVQNAIMLTHSERNWDPKKCSIYQHLCGCIRSELSHRYASPSFKNVEIDDSRVVKFPDPRPNPEEQAIYRSQGKVLLEFIDARNTEARLVAEWILFSEYKTSREIAELMKVHPNHVDHLKRRLKYILRDYLRVHEAATDSPAKRVLKNIEGGNNNDQ